MVKTDGAIIINTPIEGSYDGIILPPLFKVNSKN